MAERTVLLNGQLLAESEAMISPFDRGFLFADSVYEGLGVLDGEIIDFETHMARLERSLNEVEIPFEVNLNFMYDLLISLVRANALEEGFLYFQVTRGVADREYVYSHDLSPSTFGFTQAHTGRFAADDPDAIELRSHLDLRWARRDIKSTNLLGQVIAKTFAAAQGAEEALLIDGDGVVNEAGASSFFIVTDGCLITRPASERILNGVTRRSVIKLVRDLGLELDERSVTLDEAYEADEAFITGASMYVQAVGAIDGHQIGSGEPGPTTLRLRTLYLAEARKSFYDPLRGA